MRVVGVVVVFDTAGSWSCVAFARPLNQRTEIGQVLHLIIREHCLLEMLRENTHLQD